ncbi:nitrogen assimilation transcription factor nirA [Aspergillus udagawae]|uniref:Nitrogen assimilation transcription factor nirA n=1 Tax=Aspergillus udagawae TaxID=91492 RepID=A0A8H3N9R7_9EURO|nr:nitrogen assimilation transcription factor nirA [Aspergillus udagawae]
MASPIHQALEALVPRQSTPTFEFPLHTRGPTNAPRILAIVGFLTGLSALLVVLRYYVRLFILRRFDIEDGIILIAQACAFGVLACFIGETHYGLGHYSSDIGLKDFGPLAKWTFFHAIVIVLGISSVKISLAFFLLRFATQNKFIKRFIIGALVFLILFTIACVLTLIFQCLPVSAAWDYAQKATATCYSTKTYLAIGEFNSAINIVTDFVFATLPVFMFYNIQVNRRTRASLMGILSLGYFACAAAIAKTVYQSRVFEDKDAWRDPKFLIWNWYVDPSFDTEHGIDMFNSVELNVGIVAACFPTIKPLVKSVIGSTWSLASNSRSRKRTNNAYYGQSSSHALGSMRRSRLEHEAQKYNVHIDAVRTSLSASEGGSEENLASHPRLQRLSSQRILRTTEVIVHTEGGSDAVGPGIGPKQTVDDRV